jgi:hypothetical protein
MIEAYYIGFSGGGTMEIEHKIDSNAALPDASLSPAQTFPVDIEHTGIRVALPVIMIVGGVALYSLMSAQLLALASDPGTGAIGRQFINALEYQMPDMPFVVISPPFLWYASGFIALIVGVFGALLIGAIADRLLKRYWPSGRTLAVDGRTLRLKNARGIPTEIAIMLDRRVNIVAWRFEVKRSSPRAQRGWHMLAYQFLQDDAQVILYTFVTPKAFAALPDPDRFVELKSEPAARPGRRTTTNVQSLRASSEQKRLDVVEATRLECGAELRPADFAVVLGAVTPNLQLRSVSTSTGGLVTSLRKD